MSHKNARMPSILNFLFAVVAAGLALGQDDISDVAAKDLHAENDTSKRYFQLGPKARATVPEAGYGLVIVMPGGDGSAEFLPFVKRVFKNAVPEGYLVAQPVAVNWTADQKIVWPTRKDEVAGKKFSTEDFVEAVINDVRKRHKLNDRRIFTLAWSSSGPAAYAVSLQERSPVAGSYVAMSVFVPLLLPPLNLAKGHTYYIEHSPDDKICVFNFAERARDLLAAQGAMVTLVTYTGGHGWQGDVFGRIRTGLGWLAENQGRTPPPLESSPAIAAQAELAEKAARDAAARSTVDDPSTGESKEIGEPRQDLRKSTPAGAREATGSQTPGEKREVAPPGSVGPKKETQPRSTPDSDSSSRIPATPGQGTPPTANILENGGFEHGTTGWIILNNSGTCTMQVDRDQKKEGNQSLRITKTGRTGAMDVLGRNLSTIPKGGRLTVSASIKAAEARNAFFKFFIYDAEGKVLDEKVDIQHIVGDSDWRRVEKTFEVPENAANAAVMFVMVLDGSVWLDDVRVTGSK